MNIPFLNNITVSGVVITGSGTSNNWNTAYTNLVTNSAAYLLSGTDVNLGQIPVLSANWNSTYTTVYSNSASWGTGGGATGFVRLSGDTMTGPLITPTVSAGAYTVSSNFVIADTGTSRIFSSSDNGKCITFSNTTPVTASVPAGLPVGFNALLLQINTGQVFVSAGPGVTINSDGSKRKIASQHSAASLISYASNTFNLAGNLTT